jgi:hypothetical protein
VTITVPPRQARVPTPHATQRPQQTSRAIRPIIESSVTAAHKNGPQAEACGPVNRRSRSTKSTQKEKRTPSWPTR